MIKNKTVANIPPMCSAALSLELWSNKPLIEAMISENETIMAKAKKEPIRISAMASKVLNSLVIATFIEDCFLVGLLQAKQFC